MLRAAPLALLAALAAAGEADPAAAPPGPWSWTLRLGAYFRNTSSDNATTSRDTAIAGTEDSLSYKGAGEGTLVRRTEGHRFEQRLQADYGRLYAERQDGWSENADRIFYAATYELGLGGPHFIYGNATGESVFTGPEPERHPLDPAVAKLSAGYGQRHENLFPLHDALVARLGAYARKRWERGAPAYRTDPASGPEAYLRYDRTMSEQIAWFAQAEAFGHFDDPGHAICVGEAGLSVRMAAALTVEVKGRGYYESQPRQAEGSDSGYDSWSWRQETLIGLVWQGSGP
ncbi:MAG: hypothetical protein RL456_3551 [Pseudomonadota bacterium]|jgi:hypothetical protein